MVLDSCCVDERNLSICSNSFNFVGGGDRVFKYLSFFAIGYFAKESKIAVKLMNKRAVSVLAGIALVAVLIPLSLIKSIYIWYPLGLIGAVGVVLVSIGVQHQGLIQFLGINSIVILCLHGPIYRVLIKVLSVLIRMDTEIVRENIFCSLEILVLTLAICAVISIAINKWMPWMIGKSRNK